MRAPTIDRLPYVGTAGWAIPKSCAGQFPVAESVLARYAQIFNCVEINSSFYRPHRRATYERWAGSVPQHFRFSAKIPQEITHARRLLDAAAPLAAFVDQIGGLGSKLGPLLIQLPPSLAFDRVATENFLRCLRAQFDGRTVCEPRHASWFTDDAIDMLDTSGIEFVHANPPPCGAATDFTAVLASRYHRLHGSPRIYYSNYPQGTLARLARTLQGHSGTWCIFDNTASGNAIENAFRLHALLTGDH